MRVTVEPKDAGDVAAFIVERVREAKGTRFRQGRRVPELACTSHNPSIQMFAAWRIFGIEESVARAIVGWSEGERPAILVRHIPSPEDVLRAQARGERYVSLLAESERHNWQGDLGRHKNVLEFCVHDLCHLEKFLAPDHYAGQVGFFSSLQAAQTQPAWREIDITFDAVWERDRNYVLSDMNGSPIFLFAALKMKLKMAVRRFLRTGEGHGTLSDLETDAFLERLDVLLQAMNLPAPERESAHRVNTKRDAQDDALRLDHYFRELGESIVAARSDSVPLRVVRR